MEEKKIDYESLGFKSGLEVHQQLDTGRKLFCRCPAILRRDEPNVIIKRKLHSVAGESGRVDEAAVYQASFEKEFVYQGYSDSTCLLEYDESPPNLVDQEALKIALHISLLLNAEILPISQIMRKTVIDGSNTSGFQRTAMIARDGFIETSQGRVGIAGIFLEEDAARLIEKKDNKIFYRLDRLGIPLVEIATNPDIKNSEQVKESALMIGEILRSCKVKRGLGTIRQDINMSIKNGARTELKGVQDPDVFISAVNKEIERQLELIKKKEKVKASVRNVLNNGDSEFLRPMPGASRMYPETDLPLLKISREFINEAKKTLPKLRSEIEKELRKEGLNEEYIKMLFKEGKISLYKELYYLVPKPNFIAKIILLYPKEIAAKNNKKLEDVEILLDENYIDVLNLLIKGKIKEEHVKDVLERIVDGKNLDEAVKFEKIDLDEVEEKIMKIIKEKPGLNENAYMGLVMKEFKGKITGKEAMEIIKKFMK